MNVPPLSKLFAISLLSAVAACGGDEDDSGTDGADAGSDTSGSDTSGSDASGSDTSPDGSEEPAPNIVELASATEILSTLVAAVQAADLAGTLGGEGPFTVFAPTNDAFAALPEGALDALLADTDALTEVLLYHVASGALRAQDVIESGEVTTLQGGALDVAVDGDVVTVAGAAVATADIEASNGIVHVIDSVLLPPAAGPGNIAEVAAAAGSFTTLLAAAEAAGLSDALATTPDLTVFAPTDAAFAALPEGTVEGLLADIPELTSILLYHVVPGLFAAEDVVAESLLATLNGTLLKVEVDGAEVRVGGSLVTMTDIEASNGVIHVIDTVIIPPGTIVDIAAANPDFETLVAAVTAADLAGTLSGEGPFTVFAPTDDAFAALPEGTVDALLADIPALTDILLYHVAPGIQTAADVTSVTELVMANSDAAAVAVSADGATIANANIVVTDIPASNGIIHVIDAVILPPSP